MRGSRWVVVLACLATLLVGFGLKAPCLGTWEPGHQPKVCYNDVQSLWYSRDMGTHVAPYSGDVVHRVDAASGEERVELGRGQLEYPVVTGLFAWLTALPVQGVVAYWLLNAALLGVLALLVAGGLSGLAGSRAMLFAASPALAAYAFLNWDLLPVAATVAALVAWRRGNPLATGAFLGLGACAKIYPAFLLPPLLWYLFRQGRRREAARVVAGAVAVSLAFNLPFLLANPSGWLAPYRFQAARVNDETTNAVWFVWFRSLPLSSVQLWSTVAVLAAWALIWWAGARGRPEAFPWLPVGAAMVAAYMLFGRVDSPQYALWLLPFLVVLQVPARWVWPYLVANLAVWVAWSWLYEQADDGRAALQGLQAVTLAVLTVALVRGRPVPEPPAESDQPAQEEPSAASALVIR